MKKRLMLLAAAVGVLGILTIGISPAKAYLPEQQVQTVVQVGSGVVTTLTTNNRVWGYTVACTSAGAAGLYDTDALTTASNALLFGESTAAANTSAPVVWFPRPRKINTGVTVVCVNTTDVVTIFYE